ncbi:MAG: hypothetical protein WAV27_15005 [Xanthobacteraceae bacterium]
MRAILSSMGAFLAAGLWPRTPLAKAIVFVLVIKLIGIAGIKAFGFPDSAQPRVDAAAMARVIGAKP